MHTPRFVTLISAVGVVVLGASFACAQSYPDRPIRISPFSTRTGDFAVASYAGAHNAAPVLMEKRAPWRGQTISSPCTTPPVN